MLGDYLLSQNDVYIESAYDVSALEEINSAHRICIKIHGCALSSLTEFPVEVFLLLLLLLQLL